MIEINLTQGKVALVDDEDYDFLITFKWYALKGINTFYALTNIGTDKGQEKLHMHRLIMKVINRKDIVDHKDHDGLNNQKYNLRICTHAQNLANKKSYNGSISKYVGVSYCKRDKFWTAGIKKNYKSYWIGSFKTEEEAAKAYDKAAKEIHGEFANLNFKD